MLITVGFSSNTIFYFLFMVYWLSTSNIKEWNERTNTKKQVKLAY